MTSMLRLVPGRRPALAGAWQAPQAIMIFGNIERTARGRRMCWLRPIALWVALSMLGLSAAPPVLHAQASESAGEFRAGAGPARPDGSVPQTRAEYVSDVQGRAALRDDLERRYQDADVRRDSAERYLEALRQARPAPGTDSALFERFRQEEIRQAEAILAQHTRTQGSIRDRLTSIYRTITQDRDFVGRARDSQLSQELGPLIGTGGTAVVPVWSRPTPARLAARAQHQSNVQNLSRTNLDIQSSGSARDLAITRLATADPPRAGQWVTEVNAQGNVQLRNGERIVDLKEPAQTRSASGETIRNADAFRKAEYYSELYSARTSIENAKARLEFDRSRATDHKSIKEIDRRIADLETRKSDLQRDIDRHAAESPKKGAIANLATSAVKWAAMSAGITVAANVVSQMAGNGWDPKRIDWQSAIAPLKTPDFWGGTAGSFAVSMVASMIPGGAFIKTLASIGGAAIGWQLGTGNLLQTDWMQLGVSTLGATLGTLLGAAIGGPIGGFIGGVAGQLLANWALGKLRTWLESRATSHERPVDTDYSSRTVDPYANLSQYTGRPPPDNGTGGASDPVVPSAREYTLDNLVQLRADLSAAYTELDMTSRSANPDRQRMQALQLRIRSLNNRLQELRQEGPRDERQPR
jgi:hypothetical protein